MTDEKLGRIVAIVILALFLFDTQTGRGGSLQELGPIAALAVGYLLRDAVRRRNGGEK